jgi:hypothetical protein
MRTTTIVPGLKLYQVEFEDGSTRDVLALSLASAVADIQPMNVVSAVRLGDQPDITAPELLSLTPPSAKLGDPSFTLHVLGNGFRPIDVILWNGGAEPTTYVNNGELTTEINMATAQVAMAIPVQVETYGGLLSVNTLMFDLQAAAVGAAVGA